MSNYPKYDVYELRAVHNSCGLLQDDINKKQRLFEYGSEEYDLLEKANTKIREAKNLVLRACKDLKSMRPDEGEYDIGQHEEYNIRDAHGNPITEAQGEGTF